MHSWLLSGLTSDGTLSFTSKVQKFKSIRLSRRESSNQKTRKLLVINLCAFGTAATTEVNYRHSLSPQKVVKVSYQVQPLSTIHSSFSVDLRQTTMRLAFVFLFSVLNFVSISAIFKIIRKPDSENETFKVFSGFPIKQKFLYAVKIFSRENQKTLSGFSCSGSIVHKSWIVTAGHCVYGFNVFDVFIGNVTNDVNHVVRAAKAFIHPNYTVEPELSHDIALLKLKRSLETLNNSKLRLYWWWWRCSSHISCSVRDCFVAAKLRRWKEFGRIARNRRGIWKTRRLWVKSSANKSFMMNKSFSSRTDSKVPELGEVRDHLVETMPELFFQEFHRLFWANHLRSWHRRFNLFRFVIFYDFSRWF